MMAVSRGIRARPGSALVLPLLAVLLCASAASAQVPPPVRDTLQVDTLDVDRPEPGDTVPTVQVRPLVNYPAMPLAPYAGFAAGEWVWDREALLREAATSLLDLLERIPSVAAFRVGTFAQPEAAAAFGGTAARVELEIDGYVLDPLAAASLDLAQFPLAQLRELRVQRRLGLLRIRILTDEPVHTLPYSRVEAGIGQPAANLFRGVVLAPHVILGPLGLAIERLDSDGTQGNTPASVFSGWAKWAWTDGTRGVQLELLQSTIQREPESPWPADRTRRDVVLRARNSFAPGLLAEVYGGHAALTDSVPLPLGDTLSDAVRRTTAVQAGARVAWQLDVATVEARLRYRDAAFLPRVEAGIEADGRVGPLRGGVELAHASWDDAAATTYYGLHAEAGLPLGASVFAELTGGTRGAPPLRPGSEPPVRTERSGWRAGVAASILGGRATGSIAAVSLHQDRAHPFGLPFDTAGAPSLAGDARGVETHGRLIVVPGWLALESWISEWFEADGWTYLPSRSWRTVLESHLLPLPSGNLEILGRLEAAQRSGILLYSPVTMDEGDSQFTQIPAATRVNAYLQIRVIDVRMFVRYEDLLGQDVEVMPGSIVRGPRIFYGVKWNLWN